jgi:hypothetical protein
MTTTNNTNTDSNFINDAKTRNARINKLYTVFTKFYNGSGRTEEEKASAKENIFAGIENVSHCKRFGSCDENLVQCKSCAGSTVTQKKVKTMCQRFTAEANKQKAEDKKKKTAKKAKDQYGLYVDSKIAKVVEFMSLQPLKMADIKKATGDSYYNIAKRRTDVFGVTSNGYWFIIGTHSEALAKEIETQVTLEKKVLADILKMSEKFKG